MQRLHNTKKENLIFKDIYIEDQVHFLKPKGLWYGIDQEWIDWCKENMPGWIYPYNYDLKLDFSKILIISNLEDLTKFNNIYEFEYFSNKRINWKQVAIDFYGIEINPYLWDARLNFQNLWYYGLDCASGCVWNKKAIVSIELISEGGEL